MNLRSEIGRFGLSGRPGGRRLVAALLRSSEHAISQGLLDTPTTPRNSGNVGETLIDLGAAAVYPPPSSLAGASTEVERGHAHTPHRGGVWSGCRVCFEATLDALSHATPFRCWGLSGVISGAMAPTSSVLMLGAEHPGAEGAFDTDPTGGIAHAEESAFDTE